MNVRKIFLRAAILIVVLVAVLVVLVNFSGIRTNLRCEGEIVSEEQTRPSTIFMSLEEYRWWIRWGYSDGNLHVEMPAEGAYLYYDKLEELSGLQTWQIFEAYIEDSGLEGQYSALSKALTLRTPHGLFKGTCTATT